MAFRWIPVIHIFVNIRRESILLIWMLYMTFPPWMTSNMKVYLETCGTLGIQETLFHTLVLILFLDVISISLKLLPTKSFIDSCRPMDLILIPSQWCISTNLTLSSNREPISNWSCDGDVLFWIRWLHICFPLLLSWTMCMLIAWWIRLLATNDVHRWV